MSRIFCFFWSAFSVGSGVHDYSAYLLLRDLRDEVLKKEILLKKPQRLISTGERSGLLTHIAATVGANRAFVLPSACSLNVRKIRVNSDHKR
jgi:hypothetical protein